MSLIPVATSKVYALSEYSKCKGLRPELPYRTWATLEDNVSGRLLACLWRNMKV